MGVYCESGEKPITNYEGDIPHEWFAEVFRLFVTNPGLLRDLRPYAYEILSSRFKNVLPLEWRNHLAESPPKILANLEKKVSLVR